MRRLRLTTLRRIVYALLLALAVALIFRWMSLERWRWQWEEQTVTPSYSPTPTATPTPSSTRTPAFNGRPDLTRLFNGITLHAQVETTPGGAASEERTQPDSYAIDLKLRAKVPAPNKSLDDLAKVNSDLGALLPGLAEMITPDVVSPLFAQLYDLKVHNLRENLLRLDAILSRHNFYDCQTVLALKHPQTKRRVLLLQADMDVDADGSDGDRLPMTGLGSPTFKPFTSFRWNKKTEAPNPYLAGTEEKLRHAEAEQKNASPDRKRDLKNTIAQFRDDVGAMKKFSYLIGATDPFIVVPGNFLKGNDPVKVGDYAVVIEGKNIYPAIVGDVGPNDKVGEASLRIAKEISAAASSYNRPVNDLKATYLVFNGTADSSFGPPDLEKLQVRCETLVKEIGGTTVPLHHWTNIIPPPPTPTPTPTPSSTPTPSPSATGSVTPSASPSATFAFPTPTPSATS